MVVLWQVYIEWRDINLIEKVFFTKANLDSCKANNFLLITTYTKLEEIINLAVQNPASPIKFN